MRKFPHWNFKGWLGVEWVSTWGKHTLHTQPTFPSLLWLESSFHPWREHALGEWVCTWSKHNLHHTHYTHHTQLTFASLLWLESSFHPWREHTLGEWVCTWSKHTLHHTSHTLHIHTWKREKSPFIGLGPVGFFISQDSRQGDQNALQLRSLAGGRGGRVGLERGSLYFFRLCPFWLIWRHCLLSVGVTIGSCGSRRLTNGEMSSGLVDVFSFFFFSFFFDISSKPPDGPFPGAITLVKFSEFGDKNIVKYSSAP